MDLQEIHPTNFSIDPEHVILTEWHYPLSIIVTKHDLIHVYIFCKERKESEYLQVHGVKEQLPETFHLLTTTSTGIVSYVLC